MSRRMSTPAREATSHIVAETFCRHLNSWAEAHGSADVHALAGYACRRTERELYEEGLALPLKRGWDLNAAALREAYSDEHADGRANTWPVVAAGDGEAYRIIENREAPRRSFMRFSSEPVNDFVAGAVWRPRPGGSR